MSCDLSIVCPFFEDKEERMPTMVKMLRRKYCNGEHEKCARRMVYKAKGPEAVPNELYPGDMEQAQQILQNP